MKKDAYEILGVAKTASDDEIKKAYRKLAMKYHPDRNSDKDAEANFKDVKEAFEEIETADKRMIYDAKQSHGDWRGFSQKTDAFNDFFKDYDWSDLHGKTFRDSDEYADLFRNARAYSYGRQETSTKNEDASVNVEVTLEEAFSGKDILLTYKTPDGESRTVEMKIPAGIDTGKRLRVVGGGSRARGNLPFGDLYVNITVKPHAKFIREAQNIIMKVDVPVLDMLAGGQTRIITIDGKEYDIQVRPCTKPGTRIRIPEQGMSVLNTRLRGDMFIELNTRWPDGVYSDEVLELLKQARDLTLPKTT
jgi:curved DNA-binding protein